MTVPSTTSATSYAGTGTTPTYAFTWEIAQPSDLVLIQLVVATGVITPLVLNTDYTISGVSIQTGGTVTLTAGNLPTGTTLFIGSDPVEIQALLLQQGANYNPADVMNALDLLTRMMQATRRVANNGIQIPLVESLAGLNTVLPSAAQRANKWAAFDGNGNAIAVSGSGPVVPGNIFNVKNFGATGNGVTDDTAALQACFAAVKIAGGTMLFPPGTYLVSGGFGTNRSNPTDFANNTFISGYGATIMVNISALPQPGSPGYNRQTSSTSVINLEGNNVGVAGLTFNTTRAIDCTNNPELYRDPFVLGVVIGGKTTAIWNTALDSLSYYKWQCSVEDCTFLNINSPIYVMHSGNVSVRRNYANQWTDTGICLRDCSTDMWVEENNFTGGADDCFFAQNYLAGAGAAAGNYAGRINIRRNSFTNTFAKCIGIGGYSDIIIQGNYTSLSAGGNIVLESGSPWANNNRIYNRTCLIQGNVVLLGGQNYSTAFPWSGHYGPVSGQDQGISTIRNATRAVTGYWVDILIQENLVVAPSSYAISVLSNDRVVIQGNTCISDVYDHGSGAVGPNGMPFWTNDIRTCNILNNFVGIRNATTWPDTYHIGNTNAVSGEVTISGTISQIGEVFDLSAGTVALANVNWNKVSANSGLFSTLTAAGLLMVLQGLSANLQVWQGGTSCPRIYNSSGGAETGIALGIDLNGNPQGGVGVNVAAPLRALHVAPLSGGTPAIRIDNGTVAPGAVAITIGNGPTGVGAGTPVGFLLVDLGGTIGKVPYWV